METTPKVRREKRRRRRMLALLMAVAAVGSATSATLSLALFTDQAVAASNVFTAGTIHIHLDGADDIAGVTGFNATAMMPGDTIEGNVVVANAGTAQLRYALQGVTTADTGLAALLQVSVWNGTCGSGTALYAPAVLGGTATNMFGNPATHTGRTLTVAGATSSETLCFRAALPSTVTTGQGTSVTYQFTFLAEQTANNP